MSRQYLQTLGSLGALAGVTAVAVLSYMQNRRRLQHVLYKDKEALESLLLADNPACDCIYMDYNGTTPVYPDVLKAMLPYFQTHFGNPSSGHSYGREPRRAVNLARTQILQLLGEDPPKDISSIWFTACGTESDNLAIQLALQSTKHLHAAKPHIVTCIVEHAAVAGYLDVLVEQGQCEVTTVPVDTRGIVSATDISQAMRENTVLVTLMLANNESGALQPVAAVARQCRAAGVLFHTDAAQAVGKVSVSLKDMGDPDLVSVVGHKIGAPKGIACLYVRPGTLQEHGRKMHNHGVLLVGGAQEFGHRGGTENVPYIVGFGHAAVAAKAHLKENAAHMEDMRSRLLNNLVAALGSDMVRTNGPEDPSLRLPNTLSVGLKGVNSGDLLASIEYKVAASAGATCHSTGSISSVLRAMNVPEEFARGTLRLSVGPKTTAKDIDKTAIILVEAAKKQLGLV